MHQGSAAGRAQEPRATSRARGGRQPARVQGWPPVRLNDGATICSPAASNRAISSCSSRLSSRGAASPLLPAPPGASAIRKAAVTPAAAAPRPLPPAGASAAGAALRGCQPLGSMRHSMAWTQPWKEVTDVCRACMAGQPWVKCRGQAASAQPAGAACPRSPLALHVEAPCHMLHGLQHGGWAVTSPAGLLSSRRPAGRPAPAAAPAAPGRRSCPAAARPRGAPPSRRTSACTWGRCRAQTARPTLQLWQPQLRRRAAAAGRVWGALG